MSIQAEPHASTHLLGDSTGVDSTGGEKKKRYGFCGCGFLIVLTIVLVIELTGGSDEVSSEYMTRYYISDTDAVCNDGSPAQYYYMSSPTERNDWVLFLRGVDLWCYSDEACDYKWDAYGEAAMSSLNSDDTQEPTNLGVFDSNDPEINPTWWDANHVEFYYCSSDAWTGTAAMGTTSDKYAFMGDLILKSAVNDILTTWDLASADNIIITSSGPGGVAAVDTITTAIQAYAAEQGLPSPRIKGVTDSGWYTPSEVWFTEDADQCTELNDCPINLTFSYGYDFWQASVHPDCAAAGYGWKCFLGEYVAPFLSTPLFVTQYENDKLQIQMDGASTDDQGTDEGEAWFADWRANLIETLSSLQDGSVYFMPGCLWHAFYYSTEGLFQLSDITALDAVDLWYFDEDTSTTYADDCGFTDCNPECADIGDLP